MINCINNYNVKSNKNHQYNIAFKARVMPLETAKEIGNKIFSAKCVDVYTHILPKADADGATALTVMVNKLKEKGIKVNIHIGKNNMKDLVFNPIKQNINKKTTNDNLALILDVSENGRIDGYPNANRIIIDHHRPTKITFKDGLKYIDTTAKSCCGIIFRLFQSLGEEISKADAQNLLYAILDDYSKSKLVKFKNSELIKLPALIKDKNSNEVLEKIQALLTEEEKNVVYKRLDVMSNLTQAEKTFQKNIFKKIKITQNNKFAYVVIDPNDEEWKRRGLDSVRNLAILRDWRLRMVNGVQEDKLLTVEQKNILANVKGAIIFYKSINSNGKSVYQVSIHTNEENLNSLSIIRNSKIEWIQYLKSSNKKIKWQGGGHSDRAGGRIFSCEEEDANAYVKSVLTAAQNIL